MFGDIKSKSDLYWHLVSLRAAAIYDIFAQTCLHEFIKKWNIGEADPNTLITELPEGKISLKQFMEGLEKISDHAQVETKRNANRFLTRNLLKEVFRITQSFCYTHGQATAMTAESWYQFTRIIVNSLSHNFRLEFQNNDRKQLPVSYMGQTIDIPMHGQPLSMQLRILLSLVDDIIIFVQNRLPE